MAPIKTYIFMHFYCGYNNSESPDGVAFLAVDCDQFQPNHTYKVPDTEIFKNCKFLNGFTLKIYDDIAAFINKKPKPVCLVSHSGYNYDFCILNQELEKLKKAEKLEAKGLKKLEAEGFKTEGLEDTSADKSPRNWFEDVLCADSLYIFYDLHNAAPKNFPSDFEKSEEKKKQDTDTNEEESNYASTSNVNHTVDQLSEQLNNMQVIDSQGIELKDVVEENMTPHNEETPKNMTPHNEVTADVGRKCDVNGRGAVRVNYYGADSMPKQGDFTLVNIYYRIVKDPPRAKGPIIRGERVVPCETNNVYMMFRISHAYGTEFLRWTNDRQHKFADFKGNKVCFNNP